jgi:D-3-phosphoglycerate dehydrogenase / 2-oxoglutarate reductase
MKIYILDPFYPSGVELASKHADVVRWDDPRVRNWHEDADGIMVRMTRLGDADFARAKKLKAVAKQGVGIENIDLPAARKHGIVVCNTPGVNKEAVAEMAMALTLAVGRYVAQFDRRVRSGERVERSKLLGTEMWEKTVGIIGMGNVGTVAARMWRGAFRMKVVAYDPYVPADRWSDIPHERVARLDDLLSRADLVTPHVPLTDETSHMIGRRELALMKPTAILVNVARGGIVDEAALYEALRDGKLFGAGFDVFEEEPPTAVSPLVGLPNFVSTPHAAGGSLETQVRSSLQVATQLLDILAGKEPVNRVA